MLRVGLTGGLGSGKSTVAAMLRSRGAHILSADAIGLDLMQPGQPVFAAIVRTFGPAILHPGGALDRSALARLAFHEGRLPELDAIVHPAVIAEQARLLDAIHAQHPDAIAVVESALLFETPHAGPGGWRRRFDCVVLVTAPDSIRIDRFVQRALAARSASGSPSATTADIGALRTEAEQRLRHQLPDTEKIPLSDVVLHNSGSLEQLRQQVDQLWTRLQLTNRPAEPAR